MVFSISHSLGSSQIREEPNLVLSVFFRVHLFSRTKDSLVLYVSSAELENL